MPGLSGAARLVDRAVLRVAGDGSRHFLQGLCTQDTAILSQQPAVPAAFLSPKGRVLCDGLLISREPSEVLVDCHTTVAKSLLRHLLRHKLRHPLTIEDVSSSYSVMALLPQGMLPSSEEQKTGSREGTSVSAEATSPAPDEFFPDPRMSALGHRAILEVDSASALGEAGAAASLAAYHFWRLCCAVPEGPVDLPVDSMLPLHGNLDLLGFISFTKGCYVGQELTTRTKHRGAVRRRFFSAIAAGQSSGPETILDGLQLDPASPLPVTWLKDLEGVLPGVQPHLNQSVSAPSPEQQDRTVTICRPGDDKEGNAGTLHSTVGSVGLCMVQCGTAYNDADSFEKPPFPTGSRLSAVGGMPLVLRPPPYAFMAK